jgi:hypothetical protein
MLAHTGSLAGTPEIVEAVLKQSGIVQVTSLNEMLDTLTLMSMAGRFSRPGWRVAVLSGLGGECGNLSDVAERVGIELPPLSAATVEALRTSMPDFASPRNPLDGTGAMYEDATLYPAPGRRAPPRRDHRRGGVQRPRQRPRSGRVGAVQSVRPDARRRRPEWDRPARAVLQLVRRR